MPPVLLYHVALAALCFATRRRALGGWLLFYLVELLFYALVRVASAWHGMSLDRAGFSPSHWENAGFFVGFLLTTLPLPIATIFELGIGFPTVAFARLRTPANLARLRRVLRFELVAAIVLIVVDGLLWTKNAARDLNTLIWPVVWLAYFRRSERVARVFGVGEEAPPDPS